MGRTSDYGHGLYKQLEEVMARLDCVRKSSAQEISHLNDRIDTLEKENAALKEENQLLLNDKYKKYAIDLEIETLVTEVRIYADD